MNKVKNLGIKTIEGKNVDELMIKKQPIELLTFMVYLYNFLLFLYVCRMTNFHVGYVLLQIVPLFLQLIG